MIIIVKKLSENKISFVEKIGLAETLASYHQATGQFILVEERSLLISSNFDFIFFFKSK